MGTHVCAHAYLGEHMKTLRFKNKAEGEYQHDVERIVRIAATRGYILSPADAQAAWEAYSESMAAGWLGLPEDDNELWWNVEYYLVED